MKTTNLAAAALAAASLLSIPARMSEAQSSGPIVFLIVLENKNWTGTGGIDGNPAAPYINHTLLPMAAVANNYFNPPGIHPSLPNYLWMEAGRNFGIYADGLPSEFHQSTHAHLTELLRNAGIPWRAYQEAIYGNVCPLYPEGAFDANGGQLYQPRHLGAIYFDDVTNGRNPHSAYCVAHVRPLSELAGDLRNNSVGRYNVITPDMCHDGHDSCGGSEVGHIDSWLHGFLPLIFDSVQYRSGRVIIFVATDEARNGDGPIPFLALGHGVKHGYRNEIRYTHSSLLRTLEEIFHVGPLLGRAAYATDLRDLLSTFP
jgi:phosphatidylinositol-3-phosphatase